MFSSVTFYVILSLTLFIYEAIKIKIIKIVKKFREKGLSDLKTVGSKHWRNNNGWCGDRLFQAIAAPRRSNRTL